MKEIRLGTFLKKTENKKKQIRLTIHTSSNFILFYTVLTKFNGSSESKITEIDHVQDCFFCIVILY